MPLLNDYLVWGTQITAIVIWGAILVRMVLKTLEERREKDK